tara:strand:- start:796 stop:1014 length:219 start_codon:yes stop_codon:yes gene_type:complete
MKDNLIDPHRVENKDVYTKEEVMDLIHYVHMLEIRNKDQAEQLKKVIGDLESANRRIEFYRTATLPQKCNDL